MARISMVIVKPHKPISHISYDIFMVLYYVFISMSIFIFKVCWEIPYGGVFCFVETIQLIRSGIKGVVSIYYEFPLS